MLFEDVVEKLIAGQDLHAVLRECAADWLDSWTDVIGPDDAVNDAWETYLGEAPYSTPDCADVGRLYDRLEWSVTEVKAQLEDAELNEGHFYEEHISDPNYFETN